MALSGQNKTAGDRGADGASSHSRLGERSQTILLSLMLAVLGLAIVWGSSGMRLGTIGRMGPGYFPMAIGVLLVLTAAGIFFSERGNSNHGEPWDVRGLLVVPAAIVAFGLLLPHYGLLLACLAAVAIGRFAVSTNTIAGTLVLCVLLPLMIYAIFIRGLGLPLPILPV